MLGGFEEGSVERSQVDPPSILDAKNHVLRQASRDLRSHFGASSCSVQQIDLDRQIVIGNPAGVTSDVEDDYAGWQGPRMRNQPFSEIPFIDQIESMSKGLPVLVDLPDDSPLKDQCEHFFDGVTALGVPLMVDGELVAMAWVRSHGSENRFDGADIESALKYANMSALALRTVDRLQTQLSRALDEERSLISNRLHNTALQRLFAIELEAREAMSRGVADDQTEKSLKTIGDLSGRASWEIRRIMAVADGDGIEPQDRLYFTVENLVGEFRRETGIEVSVRYPQTMPDLAADTCFVLCSVVEECLVNVWKHSSASSVAIAFRNMEDAIVMTFSDDGVGYPARGYETLNAGNSHMGIRYMKQAVERLNGSWSMRNLPTGGAVFSVKLPILKG